MLTSAAIAVAEPALELVTKSLGALRPVAAHVSGRAQACLAMPVSTGHSIGGQPVSSWSRPHGQSEPPFALSILLLRRLGARSPTLRPMQSFVQPGIFSPPRRPPIFPENMRHSG